MFPLLSRRFDWAFPKPRYWERVGRLPRIEELEPRTLLHAPLAGPQNVMVLRVYFDDYAATSRYTTEQVQGFFGEMDQLWQNTSYGNISLNYQVSELYALPKNRSEYVNDYVGGDLSEEKYDTVLQDAIAAAPTDAGLDWSDLSSIFVVMAETDPTQFHRGEAIKRNLPQGPGGSTSLVGSGIFSENPSESDRQVWGRWTHELGHAFQQGGPAHPSNYKNEFELMDSNYPGQTGVFEKLHDMGFPDWLPETKYQVFTPFGSGEPGEGGGTANIWAMEYDPSGQPNYQAVKAELSDDLYYLVSVRRRVLGDDLNGDFPSGIPDEGVLIERVAVGGNPGLNDGTAADPLPRWVEVKAPPGGDRNTLWQEGELFDGGDGLTIEVVQKIDTSGDNYQVRVRYTSEFGAQPDVAMEPWRSAPGNTYETTDIWIDSPLNGFDDGSIDTDAFSYGVWNDLSGNPVPKGNGDFPAIGQRNRLYARVRNLGGIAAQNVVVNWQITDPAIAGAGPGSPWTDIGTVTQAQFPGLASIPGGGFVDVYVEWTPDFPIPDEELEDGKFQLHRCIRVTIDPVAGEIVLGNQDGNDEQENIFTFQAVPESSGAAGAPLTTTVLLQNPAPAPQFFFLDYVSDLPAAWDVTINGGDMGVRLGANEIRGIPVEIQPSGTAALGSVYHVEVSAKNQRTLVNDLDPSDTHIEFHSLGGVVVETRVQRRPALTIQQADRVADGSVQVTGRFNVQDFSTLYDPAHPFRVMVQAVDANRRFEHNTMVISTVGSDGTFQAQITDPTPSSPVLTIVAMFAGTATLASASTGYVNTDATDAAYYYATDYNTGRLVRIAASTGHVITVGIPVPGQTLSGLALTNSGALYGHLSASEFGGNSLYEIDRLTGQGRLVGAIDLAVGGAMAYDPIRDRIYTITETGGKLVRLSTSTGHGTTIGSGIAGLTSPGGAAFDTANDRLIVFDDADDEFYSFNPSNGAATKLSNASTALSSLGMTFTGSRFVVSNNATGTLRRVFPDTGSSSHLLTPDESLVIGSLEYVPDETTSRLLGVDYAAATLYDVGYRTGAATNPRPTGLDNTMGIAIDEQHEIYALTASSAATPNSLFKIERSTGATTLIGSTGITITEGDLDFDPTTGQLYGISTFNRNLFTVNVQTGQATVIGTLTSGDYSAMAFDARGRLYVLDTTDETLHLVSKTTGAILTTVNLTTNFSGGIDHLGDKAGMAFDPETGTLLVVDGGGGTASDAMFSLNTSTGVLTPIGKAGLNDGLAGLEFLPLNGFIRGKKYQDADGDSNLDSGESGLPGWDIFLDYDKDGVVDPISTTTRTGTSNLVPDVGYIVLPLVASGLSGPITDLDVKMSSTHQLGYTLDAYLVSPSGTVVDLFSPGAFSGILNLTTFDDEATGFLSSGTPPYSNHFWAEDLLSAFDGEDPNGVWNLVIGDSVPDSVQGFIGWGIEFTHGEQVVSTDANGDYVFTNLKPDTYSLAEVQQPGWIKTEPWRSDHNSVTVREYRSYSGRNFGNFRPGEISGTKWDDQNGNGTQDNGESTLADWPIWLDFDNDGAHDPITTTTRAGFAIGLPDIGTNVSIIATPDLAGPIVDVNVSLTINHPNSATLDAYLVSPAGNVINLFSPGQFSGVLNATFDDEGLKAEGRLAGFDGGHLLGAWQLVVTDTVPDNLTGVVTSWSLEITHGEQQQLTDGNGNYTFTDLKSGVHTVVEQQQPGWQATFPRISAWDESELGDLSNSKSSPTIVEAGPVSTVITGTVGPGFEDDVFGFVVPAGATLDSIILLDYQSSTNTTYLGIDDSATFVSAIGSYNFGLSDVGTDILPQMLSPPVTSGPYSFWLDENQAAEPYSLQFNFSGIPAKQQVTLQSGEVINNVDLGNRHDTDFGDAPDPGYPTLLASNGAYHWIDGNLYLGSSVDDDLDGQWNVTATGDDDDGTDDENGVEFLTPLIPGEWAAIDVTVAGSGNLNAWIDFNGNGSWAEPEDHVITNLGLGPAVHTLGILVPANAVPGQTYARFRLSSDGNLAYDGFAPDGEVEDYLVAIMEDVDVPLPSGQSNNIVIRRNGDQVEVVDLNGQTVLSSTPIAATNSINITGSASDADTIVVDFGVGGLFELPGGINAEGGGNLGDSLTVRGDGASEATHSMTIQPAGQPQILLSSGGLVRYDGFEQRTFEDLASFTAVGALSVGQGSMTIGAIMPIELGELTSINGGTLASNSPVSMAPLTLLTGHGLVQAPFVGGDGSAVVVDGGDLTIGNANSVDGFATSGDIDVGAHTLILRDANEAVLGPNTLVGELDPLMLHPGRLEAGSGLFIPQGGTLTGYGTVQTPNDPTRSVKNFGTASGVNLIELLIIKGWFAGTGQVDKARFDGTASPGSSPAIVQYGSVIYGPGSTTIIEIGGTTPGSSGYDQINHTGTATLGGTLDVRLINNFGPNIGDSFVIMTAAGGISDSFNDTLLPNLPLGWQWKVSQSTTELMLEVVDVTDAVDVVINGSSSNLNRSGIATIAIVFEDNVTVSGPSSLILRNHTTGQSIDVSSAVMSDNGTSTVTWDLLGINLPNGRYTAELPAAQVLDSNNLPLGSTYAFAFLKRTGDMNGDGAVNFADYGVVGANFDPLPGDAYRAGDANGDGAVNFADYGVVGANFGPIPLAAVEFDFGDAPESGTNYRTTSTNYGARHVFGGTTYLGVAIDSEADGSPSPNADGDGTDEDGVDWGVLTIGQSNTIDVQVTSAGSVYLNAWIDLNADGDWDDEGEHFVDDVLAVSGQNLLSLSIPADVAVGNRFARVRVTDTAGYGYRGLAPTGEVEDYQINLSPPASSSPFGIAADMFFGDLDDEEEFLTELGLERRLVSIGRRFMVKG